MSVTLDVSHPPIGSSKSARPLKRERADVRLHVRQSEMYPYFLNVDAAPSSAVQRSMPRRTPWVSRQDRVEFLVCSGGGGSVGDASSVWILGA